ncbi:trypsin-like peptidase domain-containing protein [Rhodoblastus sp. 17X3]|uniref:trypsin-like peptidase domain-containing protein n=1 Tax=Rhodoblastus sp. 17X3 TaxID=3047026 RepID=UPI0024B6F9AF|nr:trypsin-like peptidase domain-containing protein [Rhodoblastus sp. 17X3]MDI9849682.1 trypsin-like peptidase domain-containing protein [Rhodoblastus sp. 17X3]
MAVQTPYRTVNEVTGMVPAPHKKPSRIGRCVAAALAAFAMAGGGIYWQRQHSAALAPDGVIGKYGNSTVWIKFSWRLLDKKTGRPVFQKAVTQGHRTLPAYLEIDGKIYPWFTTEDDERRNYEVKVTGAGSGFVVDDKGFILTNKHVAAGWMVSAEPEEYLGHYGVKDAYLVTLSRKKNAAKVVSIEVAPLQNLRNSMTDWIPAEDPVVLFNARGDILDEGSLHSVAMATPSNNATLFGRNELLEVRFPGSAVSINAVNVRQSTQADAALVKVESPQPLTPVDLAADDAVKAGERVTVLGYPGVSMVTVMKLSSNEAGRTKERREVIPEPTINEGIVSRLGAAPTKIGTATVSGTLGDAFQLGINTTGAGNSGGPVFDANGKVIGLFTYRTCEGSTCVTNAVPIKHGRELLNPQRSL